MDGFRVRTKPPGHNLELDSAKYPVNTGRLLRIYFPECPSGTVLSRKENHHAANRKAFSLR